jgi:hypothetical protein
MKGIVTSIIVGLIFYPLMLNHPYWSLILMAISAILILAFWTGAVGIKRDDKVE